MFDAFVGGLFGLGSQWMASSSSAKGVAAMNAANAAEAQKQRDWAERMSSTAHQREVKDLREAGLNPILSATGGSGASSPGGSMAVMEDTQVRAAPMKAAMANLAANTAKTLAEAGTARAESKLANSGMKEKMKAQQEAAKATAKKEAVNAKMATVDAIAERVGTVLDTVRSFLPFTNSARSFNRKD